ncbi:GH22757 [Drosophila grimshawi]|uniref:GH22757 n=1 Tax=Drosophila grimshawi TaxID=7222 RepID=B4JWD9_DROGR|nr:GH22757 [Drosophila grimshawi]
MNNNNSNNINNINNINIMVIIIANIIIIGVIYNKKNDDDKAKTLLAFEQCSTLARFSVPVPHPGISLIALAGLLGNEQRATCNVQRTNNQLDVL